MKKYLEAGIIRANSIGLWYFIIHLPTTPAIDGHIFFLHFVFSLINGVELMKMAQSGLVHHWRTAFPLHNVQVSCVSKSVLVNFSPEGSLSHLWFFYDKGGFATYRTPPPAAVAHMHAARCTLHAACCTLRGQPTQDMVWKPGSIISLPTGHLHKVMIYSECKSPCSAQCCCPQCGRAATSKLAEAFTSNLQHY